MNERQSLFTHAIVILLILAVIAGLAYGNYRFSEENPGGNDFLSRWMGIRMFMARGWSPYGEETTAAIQQMAYGRLAKPGEDQMLFVYPLYSILVLAPFAFLSDYVLARAAWMTVLELSIIFLVFGGISLARWKPPRWILALILLFSVLWYHGLRPVINGNPAVLVALFIMLALIAIRSGQDPVAGFLLALSTIKPQMVVLLIPLLLLWAISHRRWTLVWSFAGSLVLMAAGCSLLLQDWLIQNLRQVLSYPQYTLAGTPGAIFHAWLPGIGSQFGWSLTILCAVVLFVEWRAVIGKDFSWLYWTACLTLTLTNLIGIRTATENYIAIFIAVVLVFANLDERWFRVGRWLVLLSILLLFGGLWALFLNTLQLGDQPLQDPVLFFPLPLYLWLSLYWVRWWAINPPRMIIDQLRHSRVG